MTAQKIERLQKQAQVLRKDLISILVPKVSHHIGCALSIIDILTVLYFKVMQTFPKNPLSKKRDIFILSKGHAGAALYVTLYRCGYLSKNMLETYDVDGGKLPEHATYGVPGVELSTGSLGHGLPVGCGFAVGFLNNNKKNRVYVLMSDGELDEGSNWESFLFAAHRKLHNLTAIIDYNKFQAYGKTNEVVNLEPLKDKFRAFNWDGEEVDGHDISSLIKVFSRKRKTKKPLCVITHTTKGKGVKYFEGRFVSHYHSIDTKTKEEILKDLNSNPGVESKFNPGVKLNAI